MGKTDGWMLNSGDLCHQISLIEYGNVMLPLLYFMAEGA